MSMQYPGLSMQYPGMPLPYPGMSLPFPGMSLPYSGMSIPFPTMHIIKKPPSFEPSGSPLAALTSTVPVEPPTTSSSSLDYTNECTPHDMTAKASIKLRLDVDSKSKGSIFLDSLAGLASEIVSYGEMYFSLCQQSGERMLSEHQTKPNQTVIAVTGLEATAAPVGNIGGKLTCKRLFPLDGQFDSHSLLSKLNLTTASHH